MASNNGFTQKQCVMRFLTLSIFDVMIMDRDYRYDSFILTEQNHHPRLLSEVLSNHFFLKVMGFLFITPFLNCQTYFYKDLIGNRLLVNFIELPSSNIGPVGLPDAEHVSFKSVWHSMQWSDTAWSLGKLWMQSWKTCKNQNMAACAPPLQWKNIIWKSLAAPVSIFSILCLHLAVRAYWKSPPWLLSSFWNMLPHHQSK